MKAFWADFWLFIVANFKWVIPTTIGMSAKLAIDSRNKKLSFREVVIKVLIGFFSGFVVSWYLITHGMERTAMWACPLATMGGEGVLIWLTQNSPKLYKFFAKKWFGMKDEDFEDNDYKK